LPRSKFGGPTSKEYIFSQVSALSRCFDDDMAGFCARAQKININKQEASIEKFLGQNQ
jgi:hypothetical protein